MNTAMKAVLDVIRARSEVEWARAVGGLEPLRPPLVAWRFKDASDETTATSISDALRIYRGPVEWVMSRGARNWVIEPARFHRYATDFRVDVDALSTFAAEYPEEVRTYIDDVPRLAEHLRRALLLHH
jgi:hypothetical protein